MINIELMTKLYMVVSHNLNEARKARDRNSKGKTIKEPEKLKIGDNILVRDHTSKVFQPKYKDFCIIGLLGKNQVEVKDNHGHTTKVHCRDVKKIPMTEKISQLYEEEQVRRVREGRKAVPHNKMPELGWDIAETHIRTEPTHQEDTQTNSQQAPCTLQAIIAIVILISTLLEHIKTYTQEIPTAARNIAKKASTAITKINHTRYMQNIRESYKMAKLVVTIATNMTNHMSCTTLQATNNNNKHKYPGTRKLDNQHDKLYQSHMPRTHNEHYNH